MKEITLSRGLVALVDDDDYDRVNSLSWCATSNSGPWVYAVHSHYEDGVRKTWYMHRFILNVTDPKILVDHTDHNGLNNTRSNIRIATPTQNGANTRKRTDITMSSRFKGVYRSRWRAMIRNPKSGKHVIGHFDTELAAAAAYNAAAYRLFGGFACLNDLTSQDPTNVPQHE